MSSKTVQNHLNFLHGIFSFSVKRGRAQSNPVAQVDRPKKNRSPHQRVRFLQPAELDELIDAVPEETLGAVERALYLVAALTGLRQGELLALKWLDIDWQIGRVRVADNFTRGHPKVPRRPLGPDGRAARPRARSAAPALALRRRRGPRLLPPRDHVLDPSKMRKRFKDALARTGVREITFHELRHTFGTQMATAGAPLRAIQEWMGHADAKTTEIYRTTRSTPRTGRRSSPGPFGKVVIPRSPYLRYPQIALNRQSFLLFYDCGGRKRDSRENRSHH